jgi:hypothetical protein
MIVKRLWLAVPLMLGLAILACNFGANPTEAPTPRPTRTQRPRATATEAEEPTRTPRPTRTPQATQIRQPTDTETPEAIESGDVIYATDFDDIDEWTTIFAVPESDNFIAEVRDGKLYVEVGDTETTVYVFYDNPIEQTDVQIDAAVETVAGPNRNNVSLVCRGTEDGWYEFSMNSGGFWFIWRYEAGEGYTSLAEGGSTAINLQRAENHLTATCVEDVLTLYINEQEAGSVTDDTFQEGFIGVSVSTFDLSGAGVEFDTLIVSVP